MDDFLERVSLFGSRIAIRDPEGFYTYQDLTDASARVATGLCSDDKSPQESRIAFLISPSFRYVSVQWGIWRAGGIAVPLCVDHPVPAIAHVLRDAQVSKVIVTEDRKDFLKELCEELEIPMASYTALTRNESGHLPSIPREGRAMILYTSGTTGSPKGVVTTHANILAQITTLVDAWGWQKSDHILNILPLHHVHGIINVLSCALWSGACCEFLKGFSAMGVWQTFQMGFVNVFMAVPTVYFKLIAFWESCTQLEQVKMSSALQHFRLMVSGSAALPVSVLEKWKLISGQTLLERYGMTEIGMALSNSYLDKRIPGYVGKPLPKVEVRLMNEEGLVERENVAGEIQIKGPSVFKEYWNRIPETDKAFTKDKWFKTGDIAKIYNGYYQIMGRDSVDIIKSGGYKISALQIEEVIRKNQVVSDCAVVGIEDEEWGEIVAAAITSAEVGLDFSNLKEWLKERLPPYQVPRKYLQVENLPRNTIGKVTKKAVKELFVS